MASPDGQEEALTRLSRIATLDGQGLSRAERRAAADGCALKRLATLEAAIADQARRLEAIKGDHERNAASLDHVEEAMSPRRRRASSSPSRHQKAAWLTTSSLRGPISATAGSPLSASSSGFLPHPHSSPAADMSRYIAPTPPARHLSYQQPHSHSHHKRFSQSPGRSPSPYRDGASRGGSPERQSSSGEGGDAPPTSRGGGLGREWGVVARFIEQAGPLLAKLGPPFSSAFPGGGGGVRTPEEVLVTLTALVPFAEERMLSSAKAVDDACEVEDQVKKAYVHFRSIVGGGAGAGSPQVSPHGAGAGGGFSTFPPGGMLRKSGVDRENSDRAGAGRVNKDQGGRKGLGGRTGGVPLEERFDQNSMYLYGIAAARGRPTTGPWGKLLHKIGGGGERPKSASMHRVPFR